MSIIKINPLDLERYTLQVNPQRTFVSSSSGLTGSVYLFSDGSSTLKDVFDTNNFNTGSVNDGQLESVRANVKNSAERSTNFYNQISSYLDLSNGLEQSTIFDKQQKVTRIVPGAFLNKSFQKKSVIFNTLFPFYRSTYPSLQQSYTNYHTLNFVTCSSLATGSVLIYPATTGVIALENINCYAPSSSFTFDFYLNPRYTSEGVGQSFSAGTILHVSSSYALSLITGTSIAPDGKADGYRLLLQLSQSAEIPPKNIRITGNTITVISSSVDPSFIFVTPDNSIKRNTWNHIAVRWGGRNVQNGTGSFVINNEIVKTFDIHSSSVMQPIQTSVGKLNSNALFVGNFYEGTNSGTNGIINFFNSDASREYGILSLSPLGASDPSDSVFRHPLNAEIHDLKIYNVHRSDSQIYSASLNGQRLNQNFIRTGVTGTTPLRSGSNAEDGLIFYVPPFFTKDSPIRNINQTPFFCASGSSNDPFNVAMSYGVGGHELNLPNFLREFVRGLYPRPYGLEARRINTTSEVATANDLLFASASNRKRNITILPCDNGKFYPNFNMLMSGTSSQLSSGSILEKFKNDFGALDLRIIDLREMVSTSSLMKFDDPNNAITLGTNSFMKSLLGATPEDPAVAPGSILTILQRTKDASSNEIVIFDISNMLYGDQIKPGTFVLTDTSVTGTSGRISIKLKDDGFGNLYRADSLTKHATWSSVGNILYEEGLAIVKSPNIPLFGKDEWEIEFSGQRNIHVLEINVEADKGLINSSTNPTYRDLIPSDYPSENASSFVYLTGLQLHDNNMNVIGRANFAQPVVKREGDRYVIRLRMDF